MGLDITAHSKMAYVGHHEPFPDDEDGDRHYAEHVEAYAYLDFAHALAGVPNVITTNEYRTPFLSGGCYAHTEQTESHGFRAGSYDGYGMWRRMMADLFNPYRDFEGSDGSPSPEGPFYHLLWFADNEGTIGELAATQLLTDFRNPDHRAKYMLAADCRMELWEDWTRACELAADGGLIDFH
jgi:hypothetical protein